LVRKVRTVLFGGNAGDGGKRLVDTPAGTAAAARFEAHINAVAEQLAAYAAAGEGGTLATRTDGADSAVFSRGTADFIVSPTLEADVRAALNTDRSSGNVLRKYALVHFSNTPPALRFVGVPASDIISEVDHV
jgi:hypothetical protein